MFNDNIQKDNIKKLYEIFAKIISLFEDDISYISTLDVQDSVNIKKEVAYSIGKITTTLIQLNKLSKSEKYFELESLSESDQEIIDKFMIKYHEETIGGVGERK
jgi:hypothetical protein